MITLVQFPWSPFCIVQRRILEYSGVRFKTCNIPSTERSLVWQWTRHRYYQVPIIKDGKNVIFETGDDSQVIAKYLDSKFSLNLFPKEFAGMHHILWKYVENDVEEITFKLNDIYYQEFVPSEEWLPYIRHKERKFGRHCLEQWRSQQMALVETLCCRLMPFEQMVITRPFLLSKEPTFLDFDLYGMLQNFLYSSHYTLPAILSRLHGWYDRMSKLTQVVKK